MKHLPGLSIAFAVCFFAAPMLVVADDVPVEKSVLTPESAFDVMKSLEGTWSGKALVVPVGETKENGTESDTTVTYRTIANDSSVMATYLEGTPMEMVSLYHLDGPGELIHTHYCAVGNQPSMRFEKTSEPGVIRFEFLRGSNMDVEVDGHGHAGTTRLIDKDTIESETELWRDGKLSSIRYTRLTRQK